MSKWSSTKTQRMSPPETQRPSAPMPASTHGVVQPATSPCSAQVANPLRQSNAQSFSCVQRVRTGPEQAPCDVSTPQGEPDSTQAPPLAVAGLLLQTRPLAQVSLTTLVPSQCSSSKRVLHSAPGSIRPQAERRASGRASGPASPARPPPSPPPQPRSRRATATRRLNDSPQRRGRAE